MKGNSMATGYFVDVRVFVPADRKDRVTVVKATRAIEDLRDAIVAGEGNGYHFVGLEDTWTTKGPEPKSDMEVVTTTVIGNPAHEATAQQRGAAEGERLVPRHGDADGSASE
jgi:hypothetical protein